MPTACSRNTTFYLLNRIRIFKLAQLLHTVRIMYIKFILKMHSLIAKVLKRLLYGLIGVYSTFRNFIISLAIAYLVFVYFPRASVMLQGTSVLTPEWCSSLSSQIYLVLGKLDNYCCNIILTISCSGLLYNSLSSVGCFQPPPAFCSKSISRNRNSLWNRLEEE